MSYADFVLVVSIFSLIFGLACLFRKDFIWRLNKLNNPKLGELPDEHWHKKTERLGVLIITLSILLILYGISAN